MNHPAAGKSSTLLAAPFGLDDRCGPAAGTWEEITVMSDANSLVHKTTLRRTNLRKTTLRKTSVLAVAAIAALVVGLSAQQPRAQEYPSRPITVIVPAPAGGGTDTQARILAPKLGQILGQAVVVENRGGASGNIGAQAVAKAEPDGYTLLAMISSHVMNPFVLKSVPYDIDHDFAMITRTVTAPEVLVGTPSLPAKDLKELLAYMRANPGKVAFGSAGVGSLSHLIVELFEQDAGVKLLHVPYRGTQPAFNDVLGGQVAIMMPDLTIALSNIQSGNVRAYGVTSAARSPAAPDLPTVAEAGLPGFEAVQWFGLAAPAGTPKDIVDKLHAAAIKALADPEVKKRYEELAMTPAPSASPQDYAKFVHDEGVRWGKVVEDGHIVAQ
jgi:tripartite-type tricarboxylate transporter receptor subunit TctC